MSEQKKGGRGGGKSRRRRGGGKRGKGPAQPQRSQSPQQPQIQPQQSRRPHTAPDTGGSAGPEGLRERVVAFLGKHRNEKFKPATLARRLTLHTPEKQRELSTLLNELYREGVIERGGGKRYHHKTAPLSQHSEGTLSVYRDGHGSVVLGNGDEVYIPARFTGTGLHGDTVSISIFAGRRDPEKRDGGPSAEAQLEGEVVAVVKRTDAPLIGTFQINRRLPFVTPDTPRLRRDIYIPEGKTGGARPNDRVSVRITDWESQSLNPEGEVTEVHGRAGEVRAEMKAVVAEFRLPTSFPKPVEAETAAIPDDIPAAELRGREDFRGHNVSTIDPEDAKDHDDALSIKPLPGGLFEVGVHIADVSHYVREGTKLDQEAYMRGTSVYLADGVIPMLPEKLSTNVCSLLTGLDRLTYSTVLTMTADGTVKDYRIVKSVIHCRKGFSYEEAQRILDGGKGPMQEDLLTLNRIAKQLLKKRIADGAVDFDTREVKFTYDRDGMPSAIVPRARLDSHRLVEEFMLLANRTVAAHIGASRKEAVVRPFVYRVHDSPNPEKLDDFALFVKHLGYSFPAPRSVTSRAYQKLLDSVRGKEEENVISELAIRSMAKAVYSDENIGHFGLGFKFYSHFTSPIRRYPDLIVHRLLAEYGGRNSRLEFWRSGLPRICQQSSDRERVAVSAERASVKVMQVEYMKRHVGEVFHAIVSGVTNFGLFVETTDFLVEGLIKVRDMDDDFYVFDEKRYQITGRRTKKRYRLGDKVKVKVVRVDPEEREIDFTLVG